MAELSGGLPPLGSDLYKNYSSMVDSGVKASRPGSANSTNSTSTRLTQRNVSRSMDNLYYGGRRARSGITPSRREMDSSASSRYSLHHHSSQGLRRLGSAECIKCMLKMPHNRCERHKYIRVGGGYRHSYSYLKNMMEELQYEMRQEELRRERLEAIAERDQNTSAKSFLSESELSDSALGSAQQTISSMELRISGLNNESTYSSDGATSVEPPKVPGTSKSVAQTDQTVDSGLFLHSPTIPYARKESDLESFILPGPFEDQEYAIKAVKTYIRTKSGRLIERVVFLSEEDYKAFMKGGGDASSILKKYLTKDEAANLDSWDKEEVKAIKTYVRTKSGRLIEKLVYVSKSDYDKIKKGDMNANEVLKVLKKYVKTEDGEKIDGWGEAKMKTIKTMVRTKSGRMIEKTILVSQEEYEELQRIAKEGGDPSSILGKYMGAGEKVEKWSKVSESKPMKVVKTMVRTKSGRLVEKTILMTEDEYRQFEESGGDVNFLKKFMNLAKGEEIETWEKASTVYEASDDDEELAGAVPGSRVVGKDGNIYEYVVDPVTGKKYKKKVGNIESDVDSGIGSLNKGKGGKGGKGKYGQIGEEDDIPTKEERKKYKALKQGKRVQGSDSEFSYRSVVSAGGTRHVKRRRKKADGTYSAEHSYHSSQDEDGDARRRRRRRQRKHGADSAHSYYSVVSAGGTRHVKRRRRRGDGTYEPSESYHSDESIRMKRTKGKKKKERRVHGSASEYSYFSEVSAGGTRRRKRVKRIRDKDGKVIGHGKAEHYTSPEPSDSDSSYESYIDAKGNRVVRKKPSKSKGKKGAGGGRKAPPIGKTRKDFKGGFSDASTDTEDEPDLDAMSEGERKAYLEAKAKRKAEREKKRREKYGDKYDEIMAQHDKNKKQLRKERAQAEGMAWDSDEYEKDPEGFKKKFKSMVTYGKGSRGLDPDGKTDGRGIGLGHSDWGGKKGKKYKDGHEADDESDDEGGYGRKKKGRGRGKGGVDSDDDGVEMVMGADGKMKKVRKGKDGEEIHESDYEYEIEYDSKGRIIRKKKKYHDGESGSEYEYDYDEHGNVIKRKIKSGNAAKKRTVKKDDADSDGDYFEKGPDGKMRLKAGKKKIDINKLTADDLRALGIDPNMSKEDIARALKAKFGDDIRITKGSRKVGLKGIDQYGSDANTDDLANDSDLDVSTIKPGKRRVNILLKKGGAEMLAHIKSMIEESELVEQPKGGEKDAHVDFLTHYRLVDKRKVNGYAQAFAVEDENKRQVITYDKARGALQGVASMDKVTDKQMDYVMKVLSIDENTNVSFRMFGVLTALAERVTKMDTYCTHLLEIANLADIERKLGLYRAMFQCNVAGDRDSNFIKAESLMIELIAGGLNWQQQDYIMKQMKPNDWREISFLDYICYIPLFLSMHDGICVNPLDMSLEKYTPKRKIFEQRDINPLGYHLSKTSPHLMRQRAEDLLAGKKPDVDAVREENMELLNRYQKLPDIVGKMEKRPPGAPRYF